MKKYAKQTALALAMALTVTSVAPATASAASAPKYKKEYNTVKKGKSYAYTVKNIKKGTKVKWSLVGTGKKYVSFNKSKAVYSETTKAAKKKTYSTNKIYIRKNTSKVVKVVVKASVTGKNGKKYSVTDKIAIAKTATKPTATPATTASTTPSTAPSTTPAATATGAATATPSVAPTATSAATATPSVAPSASTTPSTAPTATASTKPSATPAATATTKPSAAPVVTNGAITVTSNATGASVKVLNGTTVVATGTIANGKAVLPKVANGSYTVEVSAAGFVTATKAVVVNGDVTVDVQLKASKEFTAKQTGRQKILVTGTNLSDKVTDYTVKRGNASVALDKVEVSKDKTTATLTAVSSALAAGDYTIELGTQKYSFKAEAEKTVKLEIIGTNLVLTSDNSTEATIGFKAANQFDEKVALSSINVSSSLGKVKAVKNPTRNANGEITVDSLALNVTPIGSKGTIVVVDTSTGLNANAVVTLSAAARADKVTVAGIYKDFEDSAKATKVENLETSSDLTKHALLIKAYDQYENENLSVATPGGITVSVAGVTNLTVDTSKWNTNEKTKDYTVKVGDETYIAIPLTKVQNANLTAGSTKFTIIGNKKGLLAEAVVEVKQSVKIESIKLTAADTFYNNAETEVLYVAKDTTGNEVTDYNKLNKEVPTTGDVFKTTDGSFKWKRQKDGSAKLFFTPNVKNAFSASETASQPIVVTTQIGTNYDVANFTVYKDKMVKAVAGIDKGVATAAIVSSGAITLKAENIIFQDQYGNPMSDDEAAKANPTLSVKVEANSKGFDISDKTDEKTIKVEAKGDKIIDTHTVKSEEAGKTRVRIAVKNSEGKEIQSSDYTVALQAVKIDDVSEFEFTTKDDVKQLYLKSNPAAEYGKTASAISGSAIELNVTGKIGSTVVTIPASDYSVIGSSHIATETNSNKIYAKESSLNDGIIVDNKDYKPSSVTEKVEVVIGNKVGTSLKKDIIVSSVAPKAETVKLKDNTAFEIKKAKGETIIADEVYGKNKDNNLLVVKDQYGADFYKSENVRIQYTNIPDKITVVNNNTSKASLTLDSAIAGNATYTVGVTLTFNSGVTYTDTLLISVE